MIRILALRLFRLALLAIAAWLLHVASSSRPTPNDIPLAAVRAFFSDAAHLTASNDKLRSFSVIGKDGATLGTVLTTSPETDDLVGYSGPGNLLVALDGQGRVLGVQLLTSADTAAHVDEVRRADSFWKSFPGWRPLSEPLPKIEAVAGSTLTSLAIVEAVEQRLTEKTRSRRFPQPLSLQEVQSFFADARDFQTDDPRPGWHRVFNTARATLGFVVRSSPHSDNVRGYRGPTESLAAISTDGNKVLAVKIRHSFDTPEYVDRVREDGDYLSSLANRTVEEWRQLDLAKAGIEGVSGATQTSYAVAEGLRQRFRADATQARASTYSSIPTLRTMALLLILGGACLLAFTPLRAKRRLRLLWQWILIGGFGLWLGDLLSLALFAGWSRHGIPWQTAPALVTLAAIALITPWVSRRNLYCQHLCPHGAAQEILGRFHRLHLPMAAPVRHSLGVIPLITLGVALFLSIVVVGFELTRLEPFDAWTLRTGALASGVLALTGLITSLFVPMAYCRFGCPTGLILNFLRTGGPYDRLCLKDAIALGLLVMGCVVTAIQTRHLPPISPVGKDEVTSIHGKAFGSSWTVKLRGKPFNNDALKVKLQAELERIESTLSHWRPQSATSQFNASETTQETEQPAELIALVSRGLELSRATQGAYDITVGPLVTAWGYGPKGVPASSPSNEEIARLLERTGWEKLVVDGKANTLRKLHPGVQIDLGSLLQGYAADQLSFILNSENRDYLIEVGGELLARGEWIVAIENPLNPAQPLHTLPLKDAALATSAIHRSSRKLGNQQVHHFISPRTGRPVVSNLELCSVMAKSCLNADGWATALFVSNMPRAMQLADENALTVWILDDKGTIHGNAGK